MSAYDDHQQDLNVIVNHGPDALALIVFDALAIVLLFDANAQFADDITPHLTFQETERFAALMLHCGRGDLAQAVMLRWAENDEDAFLEHEDDLGQWGIVPVVPVDEPTRRHWVIESDPDY